jgi:hypothetical protein
VQESTVSAFSQWRAAASNPDLPAFLADIAVVRSALLTISKVQATANQLAKTIADKTEAGNCLITTLPCLPLLILAVHIH